MRTYRITGPDGKEYSIDGPEGATREQVIAKIQERMQSAPKPVDPYTELAQKQSVFENLAAGAGGAVHGMYLGAKQMLGKATPQEIADHKKAMAGLRSTKAGTAGDIAGNILAMVPASMIPGAGTYAGATAIGAGTGALQPTSEGESRIQNMILGGLFGAGGKYVGDKVLGLLRGSGKAADQLALQTPETKAGLNRAQASAAQRGQDLGFRMTPGEASGSKSLQKFEATLSSNPFTGGAFDDIKTHNAATLNKIAAQSIGEQSDVVSAPVLEQATDRLSQVYKGVADSRVRKIETPFVMNKIDRIEKDLEGLLPANISFKDQPLVKNAIDLIQSGQATGKQLQQMSSKLGRATAKQMTTQGGDRDLGIAMGKVKDLLDEHLKKGLKGDELKVFNEARNQYRNLMLLTSRTGVVNPSSGDVSGATLANALMSKDKRGFTFNKNQSDLYNAARFAQAFKPIVGDSGTATRSMQNLSLENLAKLPFGLVMRLYASQPSVNMAQMYGNIAGQGIAPPVGQALQLPMQKALPALGGYTGAMIGRRDEP